MQWQKNLRLHFFRSLHHCVEFLRVKPKEQTVTVGLVAYVSYSAMIMFRFEAVELKDENSVVGQALILGSAVVAPASE